MYLPCPARGGEQRHGKTIHKRGPKRMTEKQLAANRRNASMAGRPAGGMNADKLAFRDRFRAKEQELAARPPSTAVTPRRPGPPYTCSTSDQAPVHESRRRRLHRLSPISNRRRTFLEAGAISEKRHKQNSRARACDHLDGARLLGERWWLRCRPCLPVIRSHPL
jgi:hypothetical protein